MRVKCYGGPWHGETHDVEERSFCVPVRNRFEPSPFLSFTEPPPEIKQFQIATYQVERYAESRSRPARRREIRVAIAEGRKALHRHEEHDLETDMQSVPWEMPRTSILYDFENWFSKALYDRTGQVTWRGESLRIGIDQR